MPITGVLFDKDGTLFDFRASWGPWAQTLVHDLANGDAGLAQALADGLEYDLDAGVFRPDSLSIAGSVAEQAAAIAPLLPDYTEAELLDRLIHAASVAQMAPVAGLSSILNALRVRGLKLGVATNDAETSAHNHLARAGVLDHFDFVAGFDSGYGAKPAPGMCLAFADACALDPAQVAMVGDSTHDLIAGRAAGMVAVGVLTGMADHDTLAPHADTVMADISGLAAWLDAWAGESGPQGQKAT